MMLSESSVKQVKKQIQMKIDFLRSSRRQKRTASVGVPRVPGVALLQRLQQPHDSRSMSRAQALLDAIRTGGYRNPYALY